jgi:hypothetical protein
VRKEKGFILVLTLVMLLVVTLLGFSAMSASVFDVKMGASDLTSKKAFYVAEAGWNEFTARFKAGEIEDHDSANTHWKRFMAPTEERVRQIGYDPGNPDQLYIQSSQSALDYAVGVAHQVDNFKVVTKAGHPVYVVRSHGWSGEGNKVVEVTLHRCPSLDPPGALYSKTSIYVKGSSTYINGNDFCGVSNRPGIITTTDTIGTSGTPVIDGLPPMEIHSPLNLGLSDYVSYLKDYANVNYSYMDDKTLTGLDFGGLTGGGRTSDPLKPIGSPNFVHFNMNTVNTMVILKSTVALPGMESSSSPGR